MSEEPTLNIATAFTSRYQAPGDDIIGKTIEEARQLYPDWIIRVASRNGKFLKIKSDWRNDRVDVKIVNGIITEKYDVG